MVFKNGNYGRDVRVFGAWGWAILLAGSLLTRKSSADGAEGTFWQSASFQSSRVPNKRCSTFISEY